MKGSYRKKRFLGFVIVVHSSKSVLCWETCCWHWHWVFSLFPAVISVRHLYALIIRHIGQFSRQNRNLSGVTLIIRWNCLPLKRSFYFVFSWDHWFCNVGGQRFISCFLCLPSLFCCCFQQCWQLLLLFVCFICNVLRYSAFFIFFPVPIRC